MEHKVDSEKLQALLDQGGDVYVERGIYVIGETLRIHDNTRLTLAQDAVIRLADGANCVMLENDACGTGVNHRITVEGGTWDGNNAGQEKGMHEGKPYFMGNLMRFIGVEDLTVRNLCVKDPERYAMQIMNADRFTVEHITFDYNMKKNCMDGVHVQGNARNGFIRDIKGATNDDLVALNCDDYHDDGEKQTRSKGDIENITVDGVYGDNGYTAIRLLACGSRMRNINIRNVFGSYRVNGISFTHHNIFPGEKSWFDNIDIDGVYCTKPPQDPPVDPKFIEGIDRFYGEGCHDQVVRKNPVIWFAKGVVCGRVSISNVHRDEYTVTEAPTIGIDEEVMVEKLTIRNIDQRFHCCEEVPLIVNKSKDSVRFVGEP